MKDLGIMIIEFYFLGILVNILTISTSGAKLGYVVSKYHQANKLNTFLVCIHEFYQSPFRKGVGHKVFYSWLELSTIFKFSKTLWNKRPHEIGKVVARKHTTNHKAEQKEKLDALKGKDRRKNK